MRQLEEDKDRGCGDGNRSSTRAEEPSVSLCSIGSSMPHAGTTIHLLTVLVAVSASRDEVDGKMGKSLFEGGSWIPRGEIRARDSQKKTRDHSDGKSARSG